MDSPAQAGADPARTLYRLTVVGPGSGTALNAAGQVAGELSTARDQGEGFFFNGTETLTFRTPSGSLPDVLDLNDAGQVVGSYVNTGGRREAFSWTAAGGFVRIAPTSSRVLSSRAYDVNEAGQVVGTLVTPDGEAGFLWSAATGLVTRFGTNGTPLASAFRINDSGLIAGEKLFDGQRRPVVVDAATGTKTRLESGAGGLQATPLGTRIHLNNAGDVAGTLEDFRAFFSQPLGSGLFVDLERLVAAQAGEGHEGSYVTALNERGQVTIGVLNNLQAFFWSREDGLIEMGPRGDFPRYHDLNNHGTAVGTAEGATTYAVGWTRQSGAVDLNSRLLDRPADLRLIQARAINDRGVILAFTEGGQTALLTPVAKGSSAGH